MQELNKREIPKVKELMLLRNVSELDAYSILSHEDYRLFVIEIEHEVKLGLFKDMGEQFHRDQLDRCYYGDGDD